MLESFHIHIFEQFNGWKCYVINSLLKLMSQIILRTNHILKIMAFKVQVCFLVSYLLISVSHKMKFYDLEIYFLSRSQWQYKEASIVFRCCYICNEKRNEYGRGRAPSPPVWYELNFPGRVGRVKVRNSWVFVAVSCALGESIWM